MPARGSATRNEAFDRVAQTLQRFGYGPELLEWDFPVWLGDRKVTADLVAFSRQEPKDMSTAALVVDLVPAEGWSEQAMYQVAAVGFTLAAPVVGTADERGLRLAAVESTGFTRPLIDIAFDSFVLRSDLVEQLSPQRLLEMKTGSRQPGLFPIDISLLEKARQAAEDRLVPRVERALVGAFDHLGYGGTAPIPKEGEGVDRSHQRAARLVVSALTALVLRDKEDLGSLSAGALIDTLMQRHIREFGWVAHLTSRELEALTGIIAGLGADITFKGLDPAILSGVYESTLVTDVRRRQLGTHYTPPGLARRMLAQLPIEEIPPGERSVIDPTCGSGGLLLAAHDRLRALQPPEWDLFESHRELAESLRGYDTDGFAVEIARLSLFLHALPVGNGWDVRQADALNVRLSASERPAIIVANPPWRGTRTSTGKRAELADTFLHWMLRSLEPGGLIAVVLPVGWLVNRTSDAARSELRSLCDLFEVWRLAKGTFESASLAPAVLFARKKHLPDSIGGNILFRRAISRPDLAHFYRGTAESESFLVSGDRIPLTAPLLLGPLTAAFQSRRITTLASVADVIAGPQPKAGYQPRAASEANCRFLSHLSYLTPFGSPKPSDLEYARFPEDFQAARGETGLGRRKVIIPAASGPDTPWRIRTALDPHGILVRNTMHMVVPHGDDEIALYGLYAFLGSVFASCWVDEVAPERHVKTAHISGMPIPPRASNTWNRLARLGRGLARATGSTDVEELTTRLDRLVFDALDIDESLQVKLSRRIGARRAPEGVARPSLRVMETASETAGTPVRSRIGVVHDARDGRLRVEVLGITPPDGVWIDPPPGMPGAMCREDSTFDVLIPDGGSLMNAKFSFQRESWVEVDSLFERPAYHPSRPATSRVS